MKSISLNNDVPKKLFKKELQVDEYNFFVNNQTLFKEMWKAQNHEFWIKFITCLRSEVFCHNFYKPEQSDMVFIDFLKKLIAKSFDTIVKHVTNIGTKVKNAAAKQEVSSSESDEGEGSSLRSAIKNMIPEDRCSQRKILESKCVGAFVRLQALYVEATEGSQVEWQVPSHWSNLESSVKPFEEFLKARWGDSLLSKLCLEKEKVGWWDPPTKPAALPKPAAQQHQPASSGDTVKKKSSTKKKSKSSKQKNAPKEENEEKKLFSRKRNQNWFPTPYSRMKYINVSQSSEVKNYNFYTTMLLSRGDGYDFKWVALEMLLPPLLSVKFHRADAGVMHEGEKDMHHMAVATWFVTFQEAFGGELIKFMQHLFTERKKIDAIDIDFLQFIESAPWFHELENVVMKLSQTYHQYSTPALSDCAGTPEEFLLEPCVIVQLPWNQTVLHQWLAAALVQIMQFEAMSMELRHWPLSPGEVETSARELLCLVSRTKSRVLLGLALLTSPLNPSLIMCDVVLPAIPTLRFLCSGQALALLNEIKQAAFSQPCDLQTAVTLPASAFLVHPQLQKFYVKHHWHAQFWLDDDHSEPFPLLQARVEDILKQLNAEVPPQSTTRPSTTPSVSNEEAVVHNLWTSLNFENKVLGDVLKSLANPRRVIKILISLGYFLESDEDRLCSLILGDEANRASLVGFVQFSEIFAVTTFPLTGIDQNESVMAWAVRLSAEVLEREQLARLTCVCGLLLGRVPHLPSLESSAMSTRSPALLLQSVRDVRVEENNMTPTWLWQQLPPAWTQPIVVQEQEPDFGAGVVKVAEVLSGRVSRLLGGLTRNSLQVVQKGQLVFRQWQVLQYMVPGYVSALLEVATLPDTLQNRAKVKNLAKFLHCLVLYYENLYQDWVKGRPQVKSIRSAPLKTDKPFVRDCVVAFSKGRLWLEKVTQYMYAFIGLGSELEGLPGFNSFLDGMLWILNVDKEGGGGWPVMANLTGRAWQDYGFRHFEDLYRVCKKAWSVPEPGSRLLCGPVLTRVYLASAVMEELPALLVIQGLHQPCLIKMPQYNSLNDGALEALKNWPYALLSMVVQAEGILPLDKDLTPEKIELFASDGQNVLLEMWPLFVELRTAFGAWGGPALKMPSDDGDCPRVKSIVTKFMKGDIADVEKSMGLARYTGVGAGLLRFLAVTVTTHRERKRVESESGDEDKGSTSKRSVNIANQKNACVCRYCKILEKPPSSFIVCAACIKQNYPDINFFCSTNCRDAWWKCEHMAEHLEFELGLSDLCVR